MSCSAAILVLSVLGQSQSSTTAATNAQLVQAAEKSAAAAERSARAAERAAEAIETWVHAQQPASPVAPVPTPPPAPVVPVAVPPKSSPWAGSAGLSLIWLAGNSNTLTFNAIGSADKKWGQWGLGLKGYATYGQSAGLPGTPSEVTALAAGAKIRGDRNVSEQVTLFVAVGGDTNHIKSVEFVGFGEAGAGLIWLNRKEATYEKVFLRTDLSAHYEHETDFQYYPTPLSLPARELLGPRVSGVFRYALRKDVLFSQDAEVIPNILGVARTRVNANTKLASRLTETLSMNASFQLQYDSAPPLGKVSTDTALSLGVELAL